MQNILQQNRQCRAASHVINTTFPWNCGR